MAFERVLLRRLYARADGGAYLMLTFGLAVVASEAIRLLWGAQPLGAGIPDALRGIVIVLGQPFPLYRVFLIAMGLAAGLALWQFLERTRAGLLIRAVAQNPEMVHALGTDVDLVRTGVFGLGCALAALGGVLAAPLVTAFLGMGTSVVIDAFVIVIIGGMGSFLGSIVGSLLVAFVQVFGAYYFQDLALALMYLLMLGVLVVRPGGLLGKEE
jgi:branched-chain amino acid transport system permease protein